jgi:ADP-ribosylglycohydrolase
VKTSPSATGALRELVPFAMPTDDTSPPATMFSVEAARDRIVASILGLALGDALGAPFEFRRAHDVPDPLPALELPWMGLSPGTTTDDTAMARNVWTSLIDAGGELDTRDVLRRHLEWFATSPPDVGNLTRRVLTAWRDGHDDPAREYVGRRGPEVSAGNGSVMCCAPLGLAYATHPGELHEAAPALSVVALGGDTDTNAAVTGALLGALHGTQALPPAWLDRLGDRTAIEEEARLLATTTYP